MPRNPDPEKRILQKDMSRSQDPAKREYSKSDRATPCSRDIHLADRPEADPKGQLLFFGEGKVP